MKRPKQDNVLIKIVLMLLAIISVVAVIVWLKKSKSAEDEEKKKKEQDEANQMAANIRNPSLLECISYQTLGIWTARRLADEKYLSRLPPDHNNEEKMAANGEKKTKAVEAMLAEYKKAYKEYISAAKRPHRFLKEIIYRIFLQSPVTKQMLMMAEDAEALLKIHKVVDPNGKFVCNETTDKNILAWLLLGHKQENIDVLLKLIERVDRSEEIYKQVGEVVRQTAILLAVHPYQASAKRIIGMGTATLAELLGHYMDILDTYEQFGKDLEEANKMANEVKRKKRIAEINSLIEKRSRIIPKNVTFEEQTLLKMTTAYLDSLYGIVIDMGQYFSSLTIAIKERKRVDAYGEDPNDDSYHMFVNLPATYLSGRDGSDFVGAMKRMKVRLESYEGVATKEPNAIANLAIAHLEATDRMVLFSENMVTLALNHVSYMLGACPQPYMLDHLKRVYYHAITTVLNPPVKAREFIEVVAEHFELYNEETVPMAVKQNFISKMIFGVPTEKRKVYVINQIKSQLKTLLEEVAKMQRQSIKLINEIYADVLREYGTP
ncbi:hypothetical protein NEOKW01_2130 [Nematocida sp. AWRm80]|nr:hypothetical protein NEOKW01_2123 [Nematocida sp. AWRm80]KAI5181984.1 hypothetical protein NEOKW01_2130 [Nematocida sp. AWRm80]